MVIAQHLSPTHTSLLTELLARDTRFKVIEIEDGAPLLPACLYVTPPNCDVEVQGEVLRLLTPENPTGAKPSINRLFSSMAISAQARLRVGLVLSGTGSDGAKGLAELRRAGGIAVVQSLETCAYDGMPRAALESGAADLTLDPSQVGNWLARQLSDSTALMTRAAEPLSVELLDFVRDAAGLDLSGYKTGTLQRRLARRMALRGVAEPADYLTMIRAEPAELRAFVQDVFISVTEFFRDPPSIDRLRRELLTSLSQYREADPFRIWVPGCASGEEAYTIAILVEECLREIGRALDYRIFCTDIAQRPLDMGRAGSYDAGTLGQMAPELRDRYFEPEAEGRRYRITRRVRDRLVFSVHDVTADAPFSRLDLVSCRNVLIYFSSGLQRQVLEHLHYSLKPGGLMLLGASETITAASLGFTTLDEVHRLFRRDGGPSHRVPMSLVNSRRRPRRDETGSKPSDPPEEVAPRLYRLVTERLTVTSVVVNERDELMFSAGQAHLLFSARPGRATLDLVEMAEDDMAPLLRSLLFRARRAAVEDSAAQIQGQLGLDHLWQANISMFDPRRPGWLLLSFTRLTGFVASEVPAGGLVHAADLAAMKLELDANRTYLQQVVEDFEATTEQLQAANEELQSTNEEFHSTNEELQTTVEELRSTNEELHTVNDELNEKTSALAQSSRDLIQSLGSFSMPMLVVDERMRLRLFNPALDRLAPLAELSEGHSLSALPWREDILGLRECVMRVIELGVSEQLQIEMLNSNFQLTVNPYLDDQGNTRGAVLVFADVTALTQTQMQLAGQEAQLRVTLSALREGVIRLDLNGDVIYANPQVLRWFQTPDLVGRSLSSLQVRHEGHMVNLAELVEPSVLELDATLEPRPLQRVEPANQNILLEITFVSINSEGTMLVLHEVSERVRHEAELDRIGHEDHLTSLHNRRGLERLLDLAGRRRRDKGERVSVVFMDLDQFKLVNDTSGHEAGDELLRRLASLILSELRPSDSLARIGGDEFALLLPGTGAEGAQVLVDRLVNQVRNFHFLWQTQQHRVGLSCGLAELGADGDGHKALLDAGAAAEVAKRQGGSRLELASPDNPRLIERRSDQLWLMRLRESPTELLRLVPRFEQIQALQKPGAGRWELLLRYQNDDGTLTPPGEFISTAERSGFIHIIDLHALDLALRALTGLPPDVGMHVNVSPASILRGEEFVGAVEQRLKAHPVQARQLSFELTETAVYREPGRMKDFINRVSALGAQVWLDDFGAGSSTLSNLRLLPIHGIKFDGALVLRILNDEVDSMILESMQRIATRMSLLTVAEFAETPELLCRLGKLSVDFAQGWAVGKGVTAEELHRSQKEVASVLSGFEIAA